MTTTKATALLDTNILLRFALDDHPDHSSRARRFLTEVALGRQVVYLPDTAIFEAIYTLEKS
jgi:predicted nucleic acid-binding protein